MKRTLKPHFSFFNVHNLHETPIPWMTDGDNSPGIKENAPRRKRRPPDTRKEAKNLVYTPPGHLSGYPFLPLPCPLAEFQLRPVPTPPVPGLVHHHHLRPVGPPARLHRRRLVSPGRHPQPPGEAQGRVWPGFFQRSAGQEGVRSGRRRIPLVRVTGLPKAPATWIYFQKLHFIIYLIRTIYTYICVYNG